MKYYVIESRFLQPFESFGDHVPQHRAWLQQWYHRGLLLCSGPKSDRSGGILVGRADDASAVQALIEGDPYHRAGLARYAVCEFDAAKVAPALVQA